MTDAKTSQIRTFQIYQSISGYVDGKIDDWPASLQDPIYMALERKAKQVQLPLSIVYSACEIDPDIPEDRPGHFYVHVVASEIVIADERTLMPGTVQRGFDADMRKYLDDLGPWN